MVHHSRTAEFNSWGWKIGTVIGDFGGSGVDGHGHGQPVTSTCKIRTGIVVDQLSIVSQPGVDNSSEPPGLAAPPHKLGAASPLWPNFSQNFHSFKLTRCIYAISILSCYVGLYSFMFTSSRCPEQMDSNSESRGSSDSGRWSRTRAVGAGDFGGASCRQGAVGRP